MRYSAGRNIVKKINAYCTGLNNNRNNNYCYCIFFANLWLLERESIPRKVLQMNQAIGGLLRCVVRQYLELNGVRTYHIEN